MKGIAAFALLIANLTVCMENENVSATNTPSKKAPITVFECNTLHIFNTQKGQLHAYYQDKHEQITGISPLKSTLDKKEKERIIEIVSNNCSSFANWHIIKQKPSHGGPKDIVIGSAEIFHNSQ